MHCKRENTRVQKRTVQLVLMMVSKYGKSIAFITTPWPSGRCGTVREDRFRLNNKPYNQNTKNPEQNQAEQSENSYTYNTTYNLVPVKNTEIPLIDWIGQFGRLHFRNPFTD